MGAGWRSASEYSTAGVGPYWRNELLRDISPFTDTFYQATPNRRSAKEHFARSLLTFDDWNATSRYARAFRDRLTCELAEVNNDRIEP